MPLSEPTHRQIRGEDEGGEAPGPVAAPRATRAAGCATSIASQLVRQIYSIVCNFALDALRLKARAANAFALEQLQRQRMAANSGHAWGLSSDDMSSSGHADVQTYMHSKAAGNSLDSNASGDGS